MKGRYKHAFRFKVTNNEGQDYVFVSKATVRHPTRPVRLDLKAEDVRRSMKLGGVGNTQTCSMAVCAMRQKDRFSHQVDGYIDWQYSRAYVVSKINKLGHPIECYAYGHADSIAKLNDTKSGQKTLLRALETSGDRTISLWPMKTRKAPGPRPAGNKDGSRSSRPATMRGAKLRFAVAQLGGV